MDGRFEKRKSSAEKLKIEALEKEIEYLKKSKDEIDDFYLQLIFRANDTKDIIDRWKEISASPSQKDFDEVLDLITTRAPKEKRCLIH